MKAISRRVDLGINRSCVSRYNTSPRSRVVSLFRERGEREEEKKEDKRMNEARRTRLEDDTNEEKRKKGKRIIY